MKKLLLLFLLLSFGSANGQEAFKPISSILIVDFSQGLAMPTGDNFVNHGVSVGRTAAFALKANAYDYFNFGLDLRWNYFKVQNHKYTGKIDQMRLFGIGVTAGHIFPLTRRIYLNGDVFSGIGNIEEQGNRGHRYIGGKAGMKYRIYKHIFINLSYSYTFYKLNLNSAPSEKIDFFDSTGVHTFGLGFSIN